jgi:hypothetical protein
MSSIQMVNGYPCKDCTDVANAKKHIDPAHPKDGPYGVNAKTDPTSPDYQSSNANSPAVKFGGALAHLSNNPVTAAVNANGTSQTNAPNGQPLSQQTGGLLNLVA